MTAAIRIRHTTKEQESGRLKKRARVWKIENCSFLHEDRTDHHSFTNTLQRMNDNEELASEVTPLVAVAEPNVDSEDPESGGNGSVATGGGESPEGSADFDHYVDVNDELERPWPATFERSISLLAGPTMNTDLIESITKSPKITPNMAARRKVRNIFAISCVTYNKYIW